MRDLFQVVFDLKKKEMEEAKNQLSSEKAVRDAAFKMVKTMSLAMNGLSALSALAEEPGVDQLPARRLAVRGQFSASDHVLAVPGRGVRVARCRRHGQLQQQILGPAGLGVRVVAPRGRSAADGHQLGQHGVQPKPRRGGRAPQIGGGARHHNGREKGLLH